MANYKEKIKNLLIAIIFFVGLIILILFLGKIDNRSNEERIFDSIIKTIFLDAFDNSCIIEFSNFEIDEDLDPDLKLVSNIINDTSIILKNRYNKQTKEIELSFDIMIRKTSIAKGLIFSDNDKLGINFPLLYQKPIYIYWNDIEKNLGFNKEHLRILFFGLEDKINKKEYRSISEFEAEKYVDFSKDFINSVLSSNIKKELVNTKDNILECKKYNLNFDTDSLEAFFDRVLSAMLEDNKLKITMDRINTVFLFDKETIEKVDLKDYLDFTMDSFLYIDKKDIIRKGEHIIFVNTKDMFEHNIRIEGKAEIVYEKANEEIIFGSIDFTNAQNISELNNLELNILKQEILTSINNIIKDFNIY